MKIVRNLFHYLCIFVLFLTFGCQDDTLIEVQQEENLQTKSTFKSSTLYKKDIETNVKLNTKMNSLSTLQNQQIGKSVYNETYDFTIDTDIAKYVENTENDSHSYTFAIHRANNPDSTVENIVFSYDATNDSYEASLLTYHFSDLQKQELLLNGHISSSSYGISYEPVSVDIDDVVAKNSLLLPCTTNFTVYHLTPDTNEIFLYSSTIGNVHNECQHEDANGDTTCVTYTTVTIDCPDGGSAGSPTGNQNDPTNGGGGNPDMDDTEDDEPENIVTSIITREENVKQSILDCINGIAEFNTVDTTTIDPEIFSQNNLTLSNWIDINNYLQDTDCNEASQEQAIEELLDAYDDYQIINELEGKALCVYNKLKSSSEGFKNAIKKFDPDFPVAHLKFKAQELDEGTKGRTVAPNTDPSSPNSPDFVITILINSSDSISGYQQRPNLMVAKTIIHEVIHAELYRKLLSLANQGNLDFEGWTQQQQLDFTLAVQNNFPGIYDYYRRHKNWQHQQMATHYRETIARVLQEFDTGVAVPDNQQPQQLYMDLAWEGLRYVNIHTWTSLPETERTRINTVISNYISNNINETCTE